MQLFTDTSYELARRLTTRYSTSFGISSRLFARRIRPHIYAIYAYVRIADEIVDMYTGNDRQALLDSLENRVYQAIDRGYDPEPIIHAFATTARDYAIDASLIRPFFASMSMDVHPPTFNTSLYRRYIYGSADVIGLMCLKVFCDGNNTRYEELSRGAAALGSSYQKINFLRDIAGDHATGRWYFPESTFDDFDDDTKRHIIDDIRLDLELARKSINNLPRGSRLAVACSFTLYTALLKHLAMTPAATLKTQRLRVSSGHKFWLIITTIATRGKV